jgi:UDP-N-acetylmuramoyl-tripeptide--D-alanyl-D-alanine ligase
MKVAALVALGLVAAAVALASLRWLRVAQREHYLDGSTTRMALRWWRVSVDNTLLVALAVASAAASVNFAPAAILTAGFAAFSPLRLGLRGRSSRLNWTRRMTTLASVTAVLEAVPIAAGAGAAGVAGAVPAAAFTTVLSPLIVDLALLLTEPFEERHARSFVRKATERLERVHPVVVAVTGSYGKTTVKGYIAHLLAGQMNVLASPKSYNNRAGLSRTVNELLGPATEVFVAEMGTYGPGEISALCSWLRPQISVITAIGYAHFERFKSLDRTLAAKSEIARTASVVVLNLDDERLAELAPSLEAQGKRVLGASGADGGADVCVLSNSEGLELLVRGSALGRVNPSLSGGPSLASNAACAAAVALELGVPQEEVLSRLSDLPVAANRLERYVAEGGYVVLDDTFNSNPIGAHVALGRLAGAAAPNESGREAGEVPLKTLDGRLVVVTPGMVELGSLQSSANADFAEEAASVADYLLVVARTNRHALLAGASRAKQGAKVLAFDRFDEARRWVASHLGPGDAVLYENDLPDHYP